MDKIIVTLDGRGMGDAGADGFGYGVGYGGLNAGGYSQELFGPEYHWGDGIGSGYGDCFGRGDRHGQGDRINFNLSILDGTGSGYSGYGDSSGGGFDRYRTVNKVDKLI